MLFSLSGCACVAHVLRVRSATHARLSRFSAFALRLLVSCCCQAVARCSRTFVRSAPRSRLPWLLPFALWQVTSLQAKKQCSRRTTKHNFGCAFSLSGCGQGAHVPLYVPLLVLAFLDLCALLRVWSTFDKRYGAAFRDFQRLLCARLSLCFKHAPRLVLVFLGSCRLLFGKTPLCKQKSSVQDVQQKHGDLPCFLI